MFYQRKKSKKKLVLFLLILAIFSYFTSLSKSDKEAMVSTITNTALKTKQYINFDLDFFTKETVLSENEIIYWTNWQRKNRSTENLKNNLTLNQIARARVRDMFNQQYFSHFNPQSKGAEDEAKNLGFEFITIGENIALGNFNNSHDLLESWMNSPEHRENILSGKFTEIGVAAEKNIFQEKKVWIAVQIFARPLSDCLEPSEITQKIIEEKKTILENLKKEAQILFAQMETYKAAGDFELYNQKVDLYNALVPRINALSEELQPLIDEYNKKVKLFNLCLAE